MSNQAPPANQILQGNIGLTLRSMTVPVLAGMLTLMTFNLVDTFFISMLGTTPLAAISFTFPVSFTVISLAIGLSIGTSAVIAKALGAGHNKEAQADSLAALWLATYLVLALSLLGMALINPMFRLLGAGGATLGYIHDYMLIWFAGAVLLVMPMVGNAVLRASGDTKTPSLIMASGGVVNAILDPVFIFGIGPIPAMGMQGAALASVLSWALGCGLIIWLLFKRGLLIAVWQPFTIALPIYRKILRIGMPAAGANMLTPLAMAILTAIMASYGAAAVAAFGVGARLESLASLVVLALSMTLPPFVSQNFGADKLQRVQQAYRLSTFFIIRWQFAVYLLLAALAWPIAAMFTEDPDVARYIRWFLWIVPLAYGLQGITILTNSSFNALHMPANALWLSLIRLFVFYVPLAWAGGKFFGVLGVFAGCVVANVFTAAIAYSWFNRVSLFKLKESA
ncbi:putative efflux protein, MATE family [Arsukibacterium tuosuense]|uniref:Putative efflux protein, MATE family n=1 Tax=Arsukibacterium tuosuense TaxID=1323745 RepID=A0A285I7L2_9GAMM|nr:MATE family efflux transporter [Arsukibacterium tuosuense]SNY43995.1 putative efflux protein, MATE family [Arsukibacterium tuosuense]